MRQLVIGGEYETEPYQMKSGFAEVEKQDYEIHLGKQGRIWLAGNCVDKGGAIYCSGGPGSQGFGGATLEFKLKGGLGSIKLVGPWHANSDSMFADTGVDYRNHHLTFGVIGKDQKSKPGYGMQQIITDLVWFDEGPTLGAYDRIETLAKEMSDAAEIPLAYYFSSQGGSSCGFVNWEKFKRPETEPQRI